MTPFDGYGYGKSTYWIDTAKQISKTHKEYCLCWDFRNPILFFDGETHDKLVISIHCVGNHILCNREFPKTEKELNERFVKFYKS